MINAMTYLEKNPDMVKLLIEDKISLIGTTTEEMEVLKKVFQEEVVINVSSYWRVV